MLIIKDKKAGILWMMLFSLSITISMALAKSLSGNISNIMLVFLRCFFGFCLSLPFIARSGRGALKTTRFPLHSLRVLFYCAAMGFTYYAYRHLPLAEASSIGFAGPLMTTLLAALILKEKVSLRKWLYIIGGYCGVLIIINPTSFHGGAAIYILILANIFASCVIICTKRLLSTESPGIILIFTNIASLVLIGLIALLNWEMPAMKDILLLVGVGCFGMLSQMAYIKALRVEEPSFIAPFEYTRLLFSIPIGFWFFGDLPTARVLVGSFIILFMVSSLTRIKDPLSSLKKEKKFL